MANSGGKAAFPGNRVPSAIPTHARPPVQPLSPPNTVLPQMNKAAWQPPHARIVPGIPSPIHPVHGQVQRSPISTPAVKNIGGNCCSTGNCACGGHSPASPAFTPGAVYGKGFLGVSKVGGKGGIGKPAHRRKAFIKNQYSGIKFYKSPRLAALNSIQKQLRCSRVVPGGLGFWDGNRNSLHWTAATLVAFPVGGGGGACQLNLAPCTGAPQERDHINPWVGVQAGLPIYTHCTGACHYSGVRYADALAEYNDLNNLQWSCSPCNALKNGPKGYDGNGPHYVADCPGVGCPIGTGNTVQTA